MDFLCRSQLEHGEFRSYASSDDTRPETCLLDSSPFITSLILYSIGFWQHDQVQAVRTKALDFLCAEMEGRGLWRFWSSRNKLHEFLPPDLDDTCCIAFVLKKYGRFVPPNQDLLHANRNGEGIFYTWFAPRANTPPESVGEIQSLVNASAPLILSFLGELDDIDCAVNANVILYLGEIAQTKQALDYLIKLVLDEQQGTCSRYYLHPLSFYYMLSRAYANSASSLRVTADPIKSRVFSAQADEGSWGNELLTALAGCTLLNFASRGAGLDRAIEYLIRSQRDDGSWRRIPMFLGRSAYYGSEDLTTALCVELLARYL